MIIAEHPEAGNFTKYIYTHDPEKSNNHLDVYIVNTPSQKCGNITEEGFSCENCYLDALSDVVYSNRSFLHLKKFFTYQLGLYEDPKQWIIELKRAIKHEKLFGSDFRLKELIEDVIDDIIEVESTQPDFSPLFSISNDFSGATITQLNLGSGEQIIYYNNVLDRMEKDGLPQELIDEGRELLKDADKSDSLKKIAGNWIKSLPFKVMEKAGSWALSNVSKISDYQDDLMTWINSI